MNPVVNPFHTKNNTGEEQRQHQKYTPLLFMAQATIAKSNNSLAKDCRYVFNQAAIEFSVKNQVNSFKDSASIDISQLAQNAKPIDIDITASVHEHKCYWNLWNNRDLYLQQRRSIVTDLHLAHGFNAHFGFRFMNQENPTKGIKRTLVLHSVQIERVKNSQIAGMSISTEVPNFAFWVFSLTPIRFEIQHPNCLYHKHLVDDAPNSDGFCKGYLEISLTDSKTDIGSQNNVPAYAPIHKLSGLRILLVEDNKINQMVAKKCLQKWKIQVDIAENGQIAIAKIKKQKYDVVLMDLQMPKMNGYDCINYLRQEIKETLPIIVLSANTDAGARKRSLALGANEFVSKPFIESNLLNAIYSCVHQRKSID